jgi:hypothetical protein
VAVQSWHSDFVGYVLVTLLLFLSCFSDGGNCW